MTRLKDCIVCNQHFRTAQERDLHYNEGNHGYACDDCNKRFDNERFLEQHQRQKQHFNYCYCGRRFTTRRGLREHCRVKSHYWSCDLCQLEFIAECDLIDHEILEELEKFSSSSSSSHEKYSSSSSSSHEKFSSSSSSSHEKYSCDECKKKFVSQEELELHMQQENHKTYEQVNDFFAQFSKISKENMFDMCVKLELIKENEYVYNYSKTKMKQLLKKVYINIFDFVKGHYHKKYKSSNEFKESFEHGGRFYPINQAKADTKKFLLRHVRQTFFSRISAE